jgi:pheromone shutdown protein TraB
VEAWIRKPRVADFETVADDIVTVRGVFRNRLSKILLVIIMTNILGSLGALLGVGVLASLLKI